MLPEENSWLNLRAMLRRSIYSGILTQKHTFGAIRVGDKEYRLGNTEGEFCELQK